MASEPNSSQRGPGPGRPGRGRGHRPGRQHHLRATAWASPRSPSGPARPWLRPRPARLMRPRAGTAPAPARARAQAAGGGDRPDGLAAAAVAPAPRRRRRRPRATTTAAGWNPATTSGAAAPAPTGRARLRQLRIRAGAARRLERRRVRRQLGPRRRRRLNSGGVWRFMHAYPRAKGATRPCGPHPAPPGPAGYPTRGALYQPSKRGGQRLGRRPMHAGRAWVR